MNPRERDLLEARYRVGELTSADLHDVADELLTSGEDAEELIALYTLDANELRWKGPSAFESLLQAYGGGSMSEAEAVDVVLHDLARRMVEGSSTPLEAVSRAERLYIATGYLDDRLAEWSALNEELAYLDHQGRSYLGRPAADVEADVRELARATLGTAPA